MEQVLVLRLGGAFEDESGAGGDVEGEGFLVGFEGVGILEDVVSAVGGVVGVEKDGVGSGGDVEGVVGLGLVGMEVKAEEKVAAFEGDYFVLFVDVAEVDFVLEVVGLVEVVKHGLVEVAELMKFEVGVFA